MKELIICTLPRGDEQAAKAVDRLCGMLGTCEVVYTDEMNIRGCIGCNHCWLKTPGVCAIKDDYAQILKKMLEAETVVFIGQSKLGFVSHELKDVVDRVLPLVTMYMTVRDGQIRHLTRYGKTPNVALMTAGDADAEFLKRWMERVAINFGSRSLGAYDINDGKELCNALADN